jgi:hypothetical protein
MSLEAPRLWQPLAIDVHLARDIDLVRENDEVIRAAHSHHSRIRNGAWNETSALNRS